MRYNTGNPVGTDGSSDPRDLYDNAGIIDLLLTGPLAEYLDRLGVPLKSWRGIMQQVTDFLIAQGYESVYLAYGSGVIVERQTQLVQRSGELYRVMNAADIPLTLTGTWTTDAPKLQAVGDAALRSALQSADGVEYVGNAVDKRVLSDSVDPDNGATTVGLSILERPGPHESVGAAISTLYRAGKTGIFKTSPYIPSHRAGPMAYRKTVGGRAELLTDLSRFYPAGAHRQPVPRRLVCAQVAISSFTATGTTDIYRYISTAHDFWGVAGTEMLQATVIDNATGRKYADARFFPGTSYSAQVLNSAGFGGLTVDIKQAPGVAAPTTIVVELAYPVSTENRAIYVDPVNGLDTFDGSSFDWPMKTIPAAIAKAPEVIFIKPTIYVQSNYPGGYTSANDVAIKAVGGRAQFVSLASTFSAWAVDSGTTYFTTVGGSPTPVGAVDFQHVDEFGAPRILTQAASLADCRITPNSFWYDATPRNMYVNLIDGSAPTAEKVMPYGAGNTLRHSSATAKVYVSDIDFIGGTGGAISARDAGVNGVLIAERCRFLGNYNSNGADIKDIGLTVFIDCSAAYNGNDGFNYGLYNGISPHFIEIGCFGYSNKSIGTGNGSTSHDNCVGLRINCDAAFNAGPGFADVNNANTLSVNVTSRANGPSVNASGFRADGATAMVYLDGASADGNSGADFEATTGSTLRIRDAYAKTYAGSIAVMT